MSSSPSSSNPTIGALFELDPRIRYVALYLDGIVTSRQRSDLSNPSASESDKYEELLVNPTLLKLLQQRGNIDCGGLGYVLVRYGNFFEFVQPIKDGHISVGIELGKITEVVLTPAFTEQLYADCGKFCGAGHKQMDFTIQVRP